MESQCVIKKISITLGISIFLGYLLPYHEYPYHSFYNEWLVICGVIISIGFLIEKDPLIVNVPYIIWLPLSLALLIFIHAVSGMMVYSADALLPIGYLLIATATIIIGATCNISSYKRLSITAALAYSHVTAALISVLLATIQLVGLERHFISVVMPVSHDPGAMSRAIANLGQPNQLALLLCIAIGGLWWIYQFNKIRGKLAFIALVALLWGIALTQSRIGWIILPVYVFLILSWRDHGSMKKVNKYAVIVALLLYGALVVNFPTIARVFNTDAASIADRIGTHSERIALFRDAIDISLEHPWFGAGWNQFSTKQLEKFTSSFPSLYSYHTHNLILNFAAEIGWPLTLIFFSVFTYWLFKVFFRSELNPTFGFALLTFTAIAVHSMVEYPLWYAYVLMPASLFIGVMHGERLKTKSFAVSKLVSVPLFIFLSVGVVGCALNYRDVVLGFRVIGLAAYGIKAEEGSIEQPTFTVFPYFYDYLKFSQTRAHPNMDDEEINWMAHTAKRFGYPPVLMRISIIYALNGQAQNSIDTMATLHRLYFSHYPQTYDEWRILTNSNPEKLSSIFSRFAKPN